MLLLFSCKKLWTAYSTVDKTTFLTATQVKSAVDENKTKCEFLFLELGII